MDLKQILTVGFHSLLNVRGRRLKGEGKEIPAHESHAGCSRLDNLIITIHGLPPLQALHISHRGERETRVTGDEAQGTMERKCRRREDVFSFLPSFARTNLVSRPFCLEKGRGDITVIRVSPFSIP